MEQKINVAKLLKDCPSGMELDCTMYENLYFDSLNADYDGTISCYTLIDGIKSSIDFSKYGTFNNHKGAKCVIFPKGKTTWEGFQIPFKDGDIVATSSGEWIGITTGGIACEYIPTYCVIDSDGEFHAYLGEKETWVFSRLATDAEKVKLFQEIRANGYKWNSESKTLEKLVKPKFNEFKDGDVVVSSLGNIHILKNRNTSYIFVDFDYNSKGCLCKSLTTCVNAIRLATEEEKAKLFQTIKDNGYKWNAESKTLEKLPKFKVGDGTYILEEDKNAYAFTDKMIEGLAEEEIVSTNEPQFKTSAVSLEKEMEWNLPDGYIFKDENGNVINAQKIVLEKKHNGKLKLESIKKVREYWSEYARIYIEIYNDEPNECVLTHLYTLECHRQKGYGKQALSEAESIAKELGCHVAYLKVETDSWMYNWYLRCGYQWYKNADKGYTWLTKNL